MISSICLCCQHNTNKHFFQSFPPPLTVIQFRLNGHCWVWGKVSEDVGDGDGDCVFLLEMAAVPCVFGALMCQSGQLSLTATVLIRQTQSHFATFIYHSGMSQIPLFLYWSILAFWWHLCALQVRISVWTSWMPNRTHLCVAIQYFFSGKMLIIAGVMLSLYWLQQKFSGNFFW